MSSYTTPYIEVRQHNRVILLTKLRADILTSISYAATRGRSSEEGAVQRVLNSRRISGIKEFTLNGGDYPVSVVLNWTGENTLTKQNGQMTFEVKGHSAQIVDGQHRVEGIREAIQTDRDTAKLELCVAIYEKLTTQECADIFLSINTEQKPVDRSLVFDLYGIANEKIVDPAAMRARDIAMFLNGPESPYNGLIKLPGQPQRKGGIALSTVVATIKPLVEPKGDLEQLGIEELEIQKRIVLNLFLALQEKYGKHWNDNGNVFQYAAGFVGAVEFLKSKLIPYCNNKRSFEVNVISKVLRLDSENLIRQSDVKGMAGGEASNTVYSKLLDVFSPEQAPRALKY